MWTAIADWWKKYGLTIHQGDPMEKEKDIRLKGFYIKIWRLIAAIGIYVDMPDATEQDD